MDGGEDLPAQEDTVMGACTAMGGWRIGTRASLARVVEAAMANPGSHVDTYAPTWARVDEARDVILALGLDDRVRVHHALAAAISAPARR